MKSTLTAVAALAIAISPLAAQTPSQSAVTFVNQQSQSEVLGSDFIGTPVTAKEGQQIGKISNLVFDQDGRIELAVIGVGGFLGIGEKEVAVPFESLKADVANNKNVFVIDSTKEELQAAPSFKTLNDQKFNERLADWRAKASKSWAEIKTRAEKAYNDAKTRVEQGEQQKAN